MEFTTEEELVEYAVKAEGKRFADIDLMGRLDKVTKGNLGQIIEESYFGYEINSRPEADFKDLNIELKVTGVKKNKNKTLSAKERLVLNIINYNDEVKKDFDTSSFWSKNQKLLLFFYLWDKEKTQREWSILKTHLHSYSDEDLEVIKQDWEFIVNKIRAGKAHELSEGDTNYLGAASKGTNSNSVRSQPFSDIPAMQRAFSLKNSYMTALTRKLLSEKDLVRITSPQELKKKTLEQIINERFAPFVGKSLTQLSKEKNIRINIKTKAFLPDFISSLLGIKGTSLNDIEEFSKANIQFKTVRLEPRGLPKEHMSFKNVDFHDWLKEPFEDSWLFDYFSETKLLFVVFQYKETEKENPNRELYFKGVKLWNMPYQDLQDLREFYDHVKGILQAGVKLTPTSRGTSTNLPGAGTNGKYHLRTKGRDGKDKLPLPVTGEMLTKHCFWFDKEYVVRIINDSTLS
ncbi:Sau3AI family type II restriction endonuclease [Chryseomicrobium palamuruense]|uniref:Sau3AI family type II restriction endonuclease n=1 Tax=Chryseomicrobium palamuruense TaxID=682973 RepID=A0ABV8UST0_9BACL